MIYRFTISYSGFVGPAAENKLLASMRKTLKCGAKLRSTGSGFDLRNYLRDINYELETETKLTEEKIKAAARKAGEEAFDCSSIRLTFAPVEKTPSKKTVKPKPTTKTKKATGSKKR